VSFYDELVVLPLQGFSGVDNCACIHKTLCVPGYSEILMPVRLPKCYKGSEAILEPLVNNLTRALIGGSLTTVKNGTGMVRMLNFYPQPIKLEKNLLVASVTFSNQIAVVTLFITSTDQLSKDINPENPTTEELEKFVTEYKFD